MTFWHLKLEIQHLIFTLLLEKHHVILKKTLFSLLCHRYTNSCPRAQTPRGQTGREMGGGGGAGTEREAMVQRKVSSCLCRRQMSTPLITTSGPPEQHTTAGSAAFPAYRLFQRSSRHQCVAAGRSLLYSWDTSRIGRTHTFMTTVKRKWQNHWQEEGEPVRVGTEKRRRSVAILSQCQCRRLP